MASVSFTVQHRFDVPAEQVWAELIDWKAHADWIPATRVEVAPGDAQAVGGEFIAWTGYGPLTLEDRMRVREIDWDDEARRGTCTVDKLGPVLEGSAGFSVAPVGDSTSSSETSLEWNEQVTVPYLPQLLAPVAAKLGALGFGLGMRKLGRQLSSRAVADG